MGPLNDLSNKDKREAEEKAGMAKLRAETVELMKAKIPKCDVCGQDTQYVKNVIETSSSPGPPTLMRSETHFTCGPIRGLVTRMAILEDGCGDAFADLRMVRDHVFPGEKPSLRTRIRSILRMTLSRLASKL